MKLTCSQMEILVSFYLEDELSDCLKRQIEEHLNECERCSAKYSLVKTVISEIRAEVDKTYGDDFQFTNVLDLGEFKTKLSAYIDNELSNEENIKIKKMAITNKEARKELEDSYNIRRLMKESFKKTKADIKQDYTKTTLKNLNIEEEYQLGFHPAINLLIVFTISVLVITTIVLLSNNV